MEVVIRCAECHYEPATQHATTPKGLTHDLCGDCTARHLIGTRTGSAWKALPIGMVHAPGDTCNDSPDQPRLVEALVHITIRVQYSPEMAPQTVAQSLHSDLSMNPHVLGPEYVTIGDFRVVKA